MHEKQVLNIIQAIRSLETIHAEDVSAICAVLSCKIAAQSSSHPMLESACRDLGDLHVYIDDFLGEV
jgi:hypothetical protein